ncbi:MAG: glycosyltransferase family 39 protein [Candidatus Omnitrophota bacterium]
MDKILEFCAAKRTGTIIAVSIIAIFLVISLIRTYDFKTFQSIIDSGGDDWSLYARYALDIKDNGLLMPSVQGAYYFPASYLYSYFIAFCLALFGEKSVPIFIAQHLMLGLSIGFVYWAFRDKMNGLTSLIFLCTLFVFSIKDICKNYSALLLGENLALFTMALFFLCFIKGIEKKSLALQLTAASSLGLSILTRPNIVIFGLAFIPLVTAYYVRRGRAGYIKLAAFLLVFFLSSSLLLVRNYLVCKKPYLLPVQVSSMSFARMYHPIPSSVDLTRTNENFLYAKLHLSRDMVDYAEYALQKPRLFFGYYIKKALFCLGYMSPLSPVYGLRSHWLAMWAGYFLYLFFRIKDRARPEMWEAATHLFIICYYGTVIMSAPIHNYGFRMLIPVIFYVLVFAFLALDRLWAGARTYFNNIGTWR